MPNPAGPVRSTTTKHLVPCLQGRQPTLPWPAHSGCRNNTKPSARPRRCWAAQHTEASTRCLTQADISTPCLTSPRNAENHSHRMRRPAQLSSLLLPAAWQAGSLDGPWQAGSHHQILTANNPRPCTHTATSHTQCHAMLCHAGQGHSAQGACPHFKCSAQQGLGCQPGSCLQRQDAPVSSPRQPRVTGQPNQCCSNAQ